MKRNTVLKIDDADNVLIALVDIEAGAITYEGYRIHIPQRVSQKHKFLIKDLKKGDEVMMYGIPVATVNSDLVAGTVLTTENISHYAKPVSWQHRSPIQWEPEINHKWKNRKFMGYHREDGKVGTANYWLFIPLVFCENRNLKVMEEALSKGLGYYRPNTYEAYVRNKISANSNATIPPHQEQKVFKNIDGIKFLYHHGGCGGTRNDSEMLLRLLAGYINHSNVAGATVLSLGCQHAQESWFKDIQKELYPHSKKPVLYFEQQRLFSEEKLIQEALDKTIDQLAIANKIDRRPAALDKLIVGLECGGSDGFSGISANPVVGYVSDLVVSLGGAAILSEFPELNGVEQNIVDRCISDDVAEKFIKIQKEYEARALAVGSAFAMNPSPGNIKDGLITDAMKSAGAAKKGGKSPVTAILDYTEPLITHGLNLLCTPGNDVESTTGLAGSGANLILFTTGLGTPTGNPIAPVLKISSNSSLFNRMNDIIDVDAGTVITGEKSVAQVGEELMEKIINVASGEVTKAMKLEQDDFIPWKRGVSL